MHRYLSEQESENFEIHTKILTDENATRDKIAQQFREHLAKAVSGETVLFFFSDKWRVT